MSGTTEAFARVRTDALPKDASWNLAYRSSVPFEHALPDSARANHALCDRQGRPMVAGCIGRGPSRSRAARGSRPGRATPRALVPIRPAFGQASKGNRGHCLTAIRLHQVPRDT